MILRIPAELKPLFLSDRRRFLRNIANYAVETLNPYFDDRSKIISAIDKNTINPVWFEKFNAHGHDISKTNSFVNYLDPYFRCKDMILRYMHIDLSYNRDICGIAMCRIEGSKKVTRPIDESLVEIEAPIIIFDFVAAFKPTHKNKIHIPAVEELVYYLLDNLRFQIVLATFDRWQSISTVQNLVSHGVTSTFLSVDRTSYKVVLDHESPYYKRVSTDKNYLAAMEALLNAVNEGRIKIPYHGCVEPEYEARGISQFELEARFATQISPVKVDHPQGKTMDLLQSVAGALFNAECNYFGPDISPKYTEDAYYSQSDSSTDDFYQNINPLDRGRK